MIRLALLRHGHTEWNRAGQIQGRTDIALDAEAIQQLAALRLPVPWDQATLWASPLSRATQTAKLVTGRDPLVHDALLEMNWGHWEGRKGLVLRDDPNEDYRPIEDWGWTYTPPQGESPQTLRERLIPWANTLTGDNVAVCHIGVMRVILAHATGWNFDGPAPFRIKRNRLYIVEIAQDAWHFIPDPVRLIGIQP